MTVVEESEDVEYIATLYCNKLDMINQDEKDCESDYLVNLIS